METDTRYLLFQPFQCPCASLFNSPLPEAKASAKIQPFSKPTKKNFAQNHSPTAHPLIDSHLQTEKNFKNIPPPPQNSPQKQQSKPLGTQNRHTTAQNSTKTELQTGAQDINPRKQPRKRHTASTFSTGRQKRKPPESTHHTPTNRRQAPTPPPPGAAKKSPKKQPEKNPENSRKTAPKQPKPAFRLIINQLNKNTHRSPTA